jgi:hypothetical protein
VATRFRFEYEYADVQRVGVWGARHWYFFTDAMPIRVEALSLVDCIDFDLHGTAGWDGLRTLFATMGAADRVTLCPWAPVRPFEDVDSATVERIVARDSILHVAYGGRSARIWLHIPGDAAAD